MGDGRDSLTRVACGDSVRCIGNLNRPQSRQNVSSFCWIAQIDLELI